MSRLTKKLDEGFYVSNAPCTDDLKNKLGKLEDLQDELGCPLDVVFKALKEGIYFNFNMMLKEEFIEPIDLSLRFSLGEFYCLYFEQWNDGYEIDLKDYQKTWWICENGEN